jgi:VanZ family protein
MQMSRAFKIHAPTIFFTVLIFVLSSIPKLRPPVLIITIKDVWVHFLEYLIFAYFLQRSCRNLYGSRLDVVILGIVLGILYGASDEFHQLFVKNRTAALPDFFADSFGVLFGTAIFVLKKNKNKIF